MNAESEDNTEANARVLDRSHADGPSLKVRRVIAATTMHDPMAYFRVHCAPRFILDKVKPGG